MLYFLYTVDGDWEEYFDVKLPEEKRMPQCKVMDDLIRQEIRAARKALSGKFVHFIHTSPRVRDFFFEGSFINLYKTIIAYGGDVGLHCHEDEPYKRYYFRDLPHMRRIISLKIAQLRRYGIKVCAYRGGFMAFTRKLIPILEEAGISFDFSCEPGRYLMHNKTIVSDWRGAPVSLYRMGRLDHRRKGKSSVFEVPVGTVKSQHLYFEKIDPKTLKNVASDLKKQSDKRGQDVTVSVLAHSWEYASGSGRESIEEKLTLLKQYGSFINLTELKQLTTGA